MIRRNQPHKDEGKAWCQGHSLCRNPKAEMNLGCSLLKGSSCGCTIAGGQRHRKWGGRGKQWLECIRGGHGRELKLDPKCSGKPLECFQRHRVRER